MGLERCVAGVPRVTAESFAYTGPVAGFFAYVELVFCEGMMHVKMWVDEVELLSSVGFPGLARTVPDDEKPCSQRRGSAALSTISWVILLLILFFSTTATVCKLGNRSAAEW